MKTFDIIDSFLPEPDIRKRHSIVVNAPARLVYDAACHFDMESISMIRFIFRLREILMGSKTTSARNKTTLLNLLDNGWGKLAEEPGRYLIAGATCQPWQADVVFTPIAPAQFNAYSEPDQIKIVWTIETELLNPNQTRLASETRVAATDEQARIKFRRYWRRVRLGIIMIRWMLLPAIRREAMRQLKAVKT